MIVEGTKGEGTPACVLTSEELAEFRRLLLAKKRDILGDLTGMAAEAKGSGPGEEPQAGPPAEQPKYADESDDREITIGLLASERALLQEIAEALERIEKGTYGVGVATGEPIGKNRLLARPWAKYCIAHARTMEKQSKSAAGMSRRAFSDDGFGGDEGDADKEPTDVGTLTSGGGGEDED
jgi:DnaK suppressor protein